MKKNNFLQQFLFFTIILLSLKSNEVFGQNYILKSPDGKVIVSVTLANQKLSYEVSKDANTIISASAMGINTSVTDFTSGLAFIAQSSATINESYSLPSGKKSTYTNNCNELTLRFSKNSAEVQVIVRAYNDGFAYRYNIPGSGAITINGESSEFAIANFEKCWGMKYSNGYSELYPSRSWTESVALGKFAAPILIKNTANATWCLITEAANISNYTSSTFDASSQSGLFKLSQIGSVISSRPLATPWRTAIIGDLPTIVESVLVENLNPATTLTDLSWIKPGRASWDWGGGEGSTPVSMEGSKKYIDLASFMGWEYFMQDDGWDKPGFNLPELINYAKSKGVDILLWTATNRFHNDENQIRTILTGWRNMGIKGIKVDFWADDSQTEFEKYDKVLKIAAELKLMVNYHGCTKPSGLRRTWPNLITTEAIWGGEMYLFGDNTPANYNVTISMTRMAIGPMDYTPIDFAKTNGKIKQLTTWAHQLALGIVYESGIQHMNDSPDNYYYNISVPLLKKLPAAWDDIKCIETYPDQYTTIARRKSNEWYVGALCAAARTLNLDLSFLNTGVAYYANIFKDGDCNSEIVFEQQKVKKGDKLSISMRASGGASVYLSTTPLNVPPVNKYEAESPSNTLKNAKIITDPAGKCAGNAYVESTDKGNSLIFNNVNVPTVGSYLLTVYYMTDENRGVSIKVNNGTSDTYTFKPMGGSDGNGLGMRIFAINLNSGNNTIEFGNALEKIVNIDRITVQSVTCLPATPYLSVNGGNWQNTLTGSISAGGNITLGPQPADGKWSLAGPNGFTSSTRLLTLNNIQKHQMGKYTATYTSPSGCTHSMTFNVISPEDCKPTPITPYYSVNDGEWKKASNVSIALGSKISFGPQPIDDNWKWSGPNGLTSSSRQVTINNIQSNQLGDYVAFYTNEDGCESRATFTVTLLNSGQNTNTGNGK